MAPSASPRRDRFESLHREVDQMSADVRRAERRIEQLEHTLNAVAHETSGLSVSGPCTACGQCHLLVEDRVLFCPMCQYQRTL